jgi:cytochrome P450
MSVTGTATAAIPYLDVADPAFSIRSPEVRAAREQSWYACTPYGLAVIRYDEVSRLMKDKRLKQGSAAWPEHNGVTGEFADWWRRILLNLEGPDHARLRRLVNPAFSLRLIESLAPRFRALADELVDGFAERGRCEFVHEFAEPYAARVVTLLLGTPESDWRQVAGWSSEMGLALGITFKQDVERIDAALASMFGYADGLVADRRVSSGDDFVSRLVAARFDEDRLDDQELRDMLVLLIFGGIDTTRNQLGLAIDMFLQHPDQWRLLGDRPELGKAAVEEVMRMRPTVTWVTREAVEDFVFQDVSFTRGTTIHLFSESAGTDPLAVDGGFDLLAERPPHFGFGGGAHHCLGHFIARSDMSEALALLARRLHNISLDGTPAFLPDSGNTGALSLPISFDAHPRR